MEKTFIRCFYGEFNIYKVKIFKLMINFGVILASFGILFQTLGQPYSFKFLMWATLGGTVMAHDVVWPHEV